MDAGHFDGIARVMGAPGARRPVLGLLAGGAAGLVGLAAASGKKKKKKVTLCLNGQTIKVPKKKRKSYQRQGATPGACTPCVASCTGKPCGAGNGCGGVCGCPAGQVCGDGVCHVCTVTCDGAGPEACGAALLEKLEAGGAVYACPGRYAGTYFMWKSLTLIGAGAGEDPATNTILDGSQLGRLFVTDVDTDISVTGVRFTGGLRNNGSAGVVNNGTLSMRRCTVTGNVVTGTNGWGAGVRQTDEATGPLTLTDCTIAGNRSDTYGAGVAQSNATHPVTLTNCTISGNRAGLGSFGDGGGIFCFAGAVHVSGGSITDNRAQNGGGIKVTSSGTVTLAGVTMNRNLPNNCDGVAGCPA